MHRTFRVAFSLSVLIMIAVSSAPDAGAADHDLAVAISSSSTVPQAGTSRVQVEVRNLGPSDSTAGRRLVISNENMTILTPLLPLPPSVTCTARTSSFGADTVDCALPAIAPAASISIPVDMTVPDVPSARICAIAHAVADQRDPVGTNNQTTFCGTTVAGPFDSSISASSTASLVSLDSSMTYTVTVKVELGTAPKAAVAVDLGDAITKFTASGNGWTCNVGSSIGLSTGRSTCTNGSSVKAPASYPPLVVTARVGRCETPFQSDFTLATSDTNAQNNRTSSAAQVRCPASSL